jgi:hypothetical protein
MKGPTAIAGLALVLYLARNIAGLYRTLVSPNKWWHCSLWLVEDETLFKGLLRRVKSHIGSLSLEHCCELRGSSILPRPRLILGLLAPTAAKGATSMNMLLRSLLLDPQARGKVLSRVYSERDLEAG